MTERSRLNQLLDRVFEWKAPFLPTLSLAQYWTLWVSNLLGMVVYWLGVFLSWWSPSSMGYWFVLVFLLLAWTPLDWVRVFYLVRLSNRAAGDDYVPVSRYRAWMLRKDPAFEVHRVWVKHGEVLHGERLK